MSGYRVHTIDTAPEGSKGALQALVNGIGMIPNLAAAMSESPELLRGFLAVREIFYGGTFTPAEIQVLALTNAFENACGYCMAFHSTMALKEGVSVETVQALREGQAPIEPRLRALSNLSRRLVRDRGRVSDAERQAFHDAGFSNAQALEVVLGVAVSILPNFAHHLTECPVDAPFARQQWSDPRT